MLTVNDLLVRMLEEEKNSGIIDWNGSVPMIPELFAEAPNVVDCLYNNLQPFVTDGFSLLNINLGWCAYAGLGAAAMWNADWPSLKNKGIVSSLTEERGIEEMDEFVLDYIGADINSRDGKDLTDRILNLFNVIMMPVLGPVAGNQDPVAFMQQFRECRIAMFEYGVIMQMYRMGMR